MKIAVLGEALIDFIADGEGAYYPHLGGSPYNVAIGLARQGMDTSYLASLSDDVFGEKLYQTLISENVSLPLQRRSLWPTSLALVTLDHTGQPSYRLYREGVADKDTTYEEIIASLPPGLNVFHTGSLAITPSQLPKIRSVFEFLRKQGVLISIDINIRIRASIDQQKYLQGVRSLLEYADIVKASDEDLLALEPGRDLLQTANGVFQAMKGGILILTRGDGGAAAYCINDVVKRNSYTIENIVDTVGAGDTFHSAFLSYLSREGELRGPVESIAAEKLGNALQYASAAAAINVSCAGCSPPTRNEVEEFIRVHSP